MAYALLVVLIEVQRSSSATVPFDNPFWVEWLHGQRRSEPSSINGGSIKETLQQNVIVPAPVHFSTETVPLLQPLFSREKGNGIEKGKVNTPAPTVHVDSGYINEQVSDGHSLVQRLHGKVPSVNGKSVSSSTNSIKSSNFVLSVADAQSETIFNNDKSYQTNLNNEDNISYNEEPRSSSNLSPVNILSSNEFLSINSNVPLSSTTLPAKRNLAGDELTGTKGHFGSISSTFMPSTTAVEQKLVLGKVSDPSDSEFFKPQQQLQVPNVNFYAERGAIQNFDIGVLPEKDYLPSQTEQPLMVPVTMTVSPYTSTTATTTSSTTTRTLVASWPAVRSRQVGASRLKSRFRNRVPLSTRRKFARRNKVPKRRRKNLKRRRQTIMPKSRLVTTSIPDTTIGSTKLIQESDITLTTIRAISEDFVDITTRASTKPSTSTTTIQTTTITTTSTTKSTTTTSSTTTTTTTTTTATTSSTTKTSTSTTQTSTVTTPSTTVPSTTSAATFVFTNLRTASALVVTRNVTSTRVVTAPIPNIEDVEEEEATIASTTEMISTDGETLAITDFTARTEINQDAVQYTTPMTNEVFSTTTELSEETFDTNNDIFQRKEKFRHDRQDNTDHLIALPSNINNIKIEDPGIRSPRLTDWEEPDQTSQVTEQILSGGYHEMNPGQYHETNPGQYHELHPGQYHELNPGQPVLLGNGLEIQSGQYHELNPGQPVLLGEGLEVQSGQYHEINPGQPVSLGEGLEIQSGQYHETNPGQPVALAQKDNGEVIHAGEYHEVNPGQYHEVNPGQYHEVHPGQYIDDSSSESNNQKNHKVELVDVEQTDNAKIYNVQQRVNEFIIGEYGTISNSGQTLQGVRYTAVADDQSGVDPNFIYETLVKYFPMAAEKFAKSNPAAIS